MDTTFTYLNQQKTSWKLRLSQTSISNEDQEELKGHLDDVIYELSENGLPDDEIWLLAMKRIGTIDTIESEFGKINPNCTHLRYVTPHSYYLTPLKKTGKTRQKTRDCI